MRTNIDLDIQIARWPTVCACLALARQANAVAGVNPRRDLD